MRDPLFEKCEEVLSAAGPRRPAVEVFVPGRIELFGKHTDYSGGTSIVAATDKGFRMAAVPRSDSVVRMIPVGEPDSVESFTIGDSPDISAGHWLNYPATTARRIALNFSEHLELKGADIAFTSDLPVAAGMSSSSALMVGTFLIIANLHRLMDTEPWRENIGSSEELAEYLGCVENGQTYGTLTGEAGVGTFGGSEDHAAMLCSQEGQLSVYRFDPITLVTRIDWDDSLAIVVVTSGVAAEKTGEAREDYNRAALRASAAVEAFNSSEGTAFRHLGDLADEAERLGLETILIVLNSAEEKQDRFAGMQLSRRFEQFYHEDREYVPAAVEALRRRDLQSLRDLSDASHRGAVTGLQNQIPQTNTLASLGLEHGALAASAFGAGFGGSVWAIIETSEADAFTRSWFSDYRTKYPEDAEKAGTLIMQPASASQVTQAAETI